MFCTLYGSFSKPSDQSQHRAARRRQSQLSSLESNPQPFRSKTVPLPTDPQEPKSWSYSYSKKEKALIVGLKK